MQYQLATRSVNLQRIHMVLRHVLANEDEADRQKKNSFIIRMDILETTNVWSLVIIPNCSIKIN